MKARVPLQARAHATRERILDVVVETLAKCGYSGTTTVEICKRAGASRGTLLHHFPTKHDLVVAAIAHILDRRLREFVDGFAALPPERQVPAEALDLLWRLYAGSTFYAWLELLVAARTDPPLRRELKKVIDRFGVRSDAIVRELFPDVGGMGPLGEQPMRFVFPLFNGLAIDRIHTGAEQADGIVARLVALLRAN